MQLGSEALRGYKQRKLNDHVYSFPLFSSSRLHYEAEFLLYRKWPTVNNLFCCCEISAWIPQT